MYLVELTFKTEDQTQTDVASHALNGLLSALRFNGQICGREFPIVTSSKGYSASILIPEQGSLDESHNNKYVRDALEKLKGIGLSQPQISLLSKDIDGAEVCSCSSPTAYLLYTNYLSLESPLRCADCFLPVPLYRIPHTNKDDYYDIIGWQSDYQSCDSLQMNCGTLERAATREMSKVDSSLSVRGREICAKIAEITQRPTYYYLYRYGGRSRKQELKRLCPLCNGQWLVEPTWYLFDFKCDKCHLVSNVAWDV